MTRSITESLTVVAVCVLVVVATRWASGEWAKQADERRPGIALNGEDVRCGEPRANCDPVVPGTFDTLDRQIDARVSAEFWRGYAAGLEQCGPMLGIKK